MLPFGIFVNNVYLSIFYLDSFLSWFPRDSNVVFFSIMIFFRNCTFTLFYYINICFVVLGFVVFQFSVFVFQFGIIIIFVVWSSNITNLWPTNPFRLILILCWYGLDLKQWCQPVLYWLAFGIFSPKLLKVQVKAILTILLLIHSYISMKHMY